MWFPNARRANHLALRSTYARHHDPAFLFRDLAQTTFSSEAQLDALVTRALNDQPWRDAVIAMVARVAREHLTTDVLAQRMIDLVSGSTSAA
jgi:hypothetical protein